MLHRIPTTHADEVRAATGAVDVFGRDRHLNGTYALRCTVCEFASCLCAYVYVYAYVFVLVISF